MPSVSSDQPWPWNNLDHSSAAALLSGHLPKADRGSLEPFGSGDFCIAFKLGEQVIRVARHPEAAAALRRETCVLAVIAGMLSLPVPRPTYHSPSGCPAFTMHREVVGDVLTREAWEDLPIFEQEKAAADLAHFLRTFHSIPIELSQKCELTNLGAATFAHTLREASRNTIYKFLDQETRHHLDTTLEKWSFLSQPDRWQPSLLHCDVGPGHVLYDPLTHRLTGVIDFGDIAVGEPARDFIYIYEDFGPALLGEVLHHYAGNKTPTMMPEIRKWYLIEAISWTIQMYRKKREADLRHGLAEIRRELAVGFG
jgi:aminoglycoside 2''-phosphotransferase